MDVAHGDEEGRGRKDSDAGDGEKKLDRGDLLPEPLELAPEADGLGFEFPDLFEGLEEGVTEKAGNQLMVEGAMGMGQEGSGALGDGDAELSEKAANGIDAGSAAGEVPGAQAVQGRDGLLLQGFHGDRRDLLVATSLEDGPGIGPIGLVAQTVASDMGSWEKRDLMAEGLEFPAPVVSGATGLHEHMARRLVQEELPKSSAGKAVLFGDPAGSVRDGNLEDGLCEIHSDARSVHADSSPVLGLRGRD